MSTKPFSFLSEKQVDELEFLVDCYKIRCENCGELFGVSPKSQEGQPFFHCVQCIVKIIGGVIDNKE